MNCLKYVGMVVSLTLLGGCASVSVRSAEQTHYQPAPRLPAKIYVKNFAMPEENFRVDRSGEALLIFRQNLAKNLSDQLKLRLERHLVSAEIVPRDFVPPSANAWLIDGRFDRVEQGSRALRALIGLGTGGTKIETTVTIYDLAAAKPSPFLLIRTTGGSNAMPGAVANINPVMLIPSIIGVVSGAAGGINTGLGFDIKRTAREITAVLSNYAAGRDMIPAEKAMQPKRLGTAPLRIVDPV